MFLDDKGFSETLTQLRADYAANLPNEFRELRELFWKFVQAPGHYDLIRACYIRVHNLKGSGTTFGFPEITEIAGELTAILGPIQEGKVAPSAEITTEVSHLLYLMEERIDEVSLSLPRKSEEKVTGQAAESTHNKDKENDDLVYILEDDPSLSSLIKFHLEVLGFEVIIFSDLQDFKTNMETRRPTLLILDIVFPEDDLGGLNIIDELEMQSKDQVPVLVVSNRDDIEARLKSVRLGVKVYLKKPVDIFLLIDEIDALLTETGNSSFKVMVVDDEPLMAEFYSSILRNAGFNTLIITEPLEVLDKLQDYVPDLIVLDLNMPKCSGIELAKVIRQKRELSAVPIVYLTAEQDMGKQKQALYSGGDDYLVKPVDAELFVSRVRSRAIRFHDLRSIMAHDPLTGLLNHSNLLDALESSLIRAKRGKGQVSFCMIDVDDFKSLNDRYGHQTGDMVLKSLSKLLSKRVRRSDSVGRYGGEEFALVLETDENNAFLIMDEIRNVFSRIVFNSHNKEFTVTFSAGIASFPDFKERVTMIESADRALYRAKREGKDKILISSALKS